MPTPKEILGAASLASMSVDISDSMLMEGPPCSLVNDELLSGGNGLDKWVDVSGFNSISFTLSASVGTSGGSYLVEVTNDTTVPPSPLVHYSLTAQTPVSTPVSIAGGSGQTFVAQLHARYLRIRMVTAPTGGSYRVSAQLGRAPVSLPAIQIFREVATMDRFCTHTTLTTTPLVASTTFTSPLQDHGGIAYTAFNVHATSDQTGSFRVETSVDSGVTWRRASAEISVTAALPAVFSMPITVRHYRVVYTNFGTTQGWFNLSSSFTKS